MNKNILFKGVLSAIFILFSFTAVRSQSSQPQSQDIDTERIRYIENVFNESAITSQIWWYGWMGTYSAVAVVSFSIGAVSNNDAVKIVQYVSGVEALIGVAGLLASPMTSAYASWRLRPMPFGTAEERKEKLARGETYLDDCAEGQALGSSWITHTLNVAINAAGGLVIWKGYEKRIRNAGSNPMTQGLINFLAGTAVGEIQIFTQPTRGIEDRRIYNQRYRSNARSAGLDVRLFFVPWNDGFAAGVSALL
jgi:hypothetical protein